MWSTNDFLDGFFDAFETFAMATTAQGWQSVNQFPRIDRSSRRESQPPFNSVMKPLRAELISVKCRVIGPFDRSASVKSKNTVVPARLSNKIGPIFLVHIGPHQ